MVSISCNINRIHLSSHLLPLSSVISEMVDYDMFMHHNGKIDAFSINS